MILSAQSIARQLKWDNRHLDMASFVALQRSKDTTKVGAVLVSPNGAELLNAFNGPPQGVEDNPTRFERPAKYFYASHAEANLIGFAARLGIRTEGCAVYVTHAPCADCAKAMIQAGIKRVVHRRGALGSPDWEASLSAAREMLGEAGVVCEAIE